MAINILDYLTPNSQSSAGQYFPYTGDTMQSVANEAAQPQQGLLTPASGADMVNAATQQATNDAQVKHQQQKIGEQVMQAQQQAQAEQEQRVSNALQQGFTDRTGVSPQQLMSGLLSNGNRMSSAEAQARQQEIGLKQVYANASEGYAQAQQAYQNAEASGDEATMNKMQGIMNAAQQVMQNASEGANSLRESAQAAGINLAGAGQTLQQAKQAYQNNAMRDMANLTNGMSSDQYYWQEYQRLLDSGAGTDRANRLARRAASVYQANRLAQAKDAFNNYGLNGDGAMNDFGVRALALMANEGDNSAQAYFTAYAKPINEFTAAQKRQIEAMKEKYGWNTTQAKLAMQLGIAKMNEQGRDRRHAQDIAQKNYALSVTEAGKDKRNAENNNVKIGLKKAELNKNNSDKQLAEDWRVVNSVNEEVAKNKDNPDYDMSHNEFVSSGAYDNAKERIKANQGASIANIDWSDPETGAASYVTKLIAQNDVDNGKYSKQDLIDAVRNKVYQETGDYDKAVDIADNISEWDNWSNYGY